MKDYNFAQKSWEYALKMHTFYCANIIKFKDLEADGCKMLVERWVNSKNLLEAKYSCLKQ